MPKTKKNQNDDLKLLLKQATKSLDSMVIKKQVTKKKGFMSYIFSKIKRKH